MNAKEILAEWLKDHKYDGLCDPYNECGCFIDDLMPCESCPDQCVAAHQADDGGFAEMKE